MNIVKCDLCGSSDMANENDFLVCRYCRAKYTKQSASGFANNRELFTLIVASDGKEYAKLETNHEIVAFSKILHETLLQESQYSVTIASEEATEAESLEIKKLVQKTIIGVVSQYSLVHNGLIPCELRDNLLNISSEALAELLNEINSQFVHEVLLLTNDN